MKNSMLNKGLLLMGLMACWAGLWAGGGNVVSKNHSEIPDSVYMALVDSIFSDLLEMDYIHPVLEHLQESNRMVYRHADGIQVRISQQHNARKLPRSDYYTMLELMFKIHSADHEGHEAGGEPLFRYWEREMGASTDWQLGRMKVSLSASGKGNERLIQLMTKEMDKRFEPFRKAHALPEMFLSVDVMQSSDVAAADRFVERLKHLVFDGREADRMDLQLSTYEDHEEYRLGLAWQGKTSHRFNIELRMEEGLEAGEGYGSLLEQGSFRYCQIPGENYRINANVATEEDSELGRLAEEVIGEFLSDIQH